MFSRSTHFVSNLKVPQLPQLATVIVVIVCGLFVLLSVSAEGLVVQDPTLPADAIVVIGGDHKPSRIRKAVELYSHGYAPIVIISGGARVKEGSDWIIEAELMRYQALGQGLPDQIILLETQSTTTVENAFYVAETCRNHGFRRILLVTSPFHSRRAKMIFRDVLDPSVNILVQPALDSGFCVTCWWQRSDTRLVVLSEYAKLALYLTTGR